MITPIRTDPFIFRGKVCEAGYEWIKDAEGKPRLVSRHVPGTGFRPYEPPTGLFRDFVKLSPTRDAIQEFARQHGDLFSRYESRQRAVRSDGTVGHGATLGTWTQEIGDMRTLVDLWGWIQDRRIPELKKIIKWTDDDVSYTIKTPRYDTRDVTLAHAQLTGSGFFSHFSPSDVLLPARCALQQEINSRIAEQPPTPRLAWTPEYKQRIIFTPPNLLSAMWLQFAQSVTGELQLQVCAVCGKHYQIGPGGRRADSTTCSDACKQQKWRNTHGK